MCAVQETPQGRIMGYGASPFIFPFSPQHGLSLPSRSAVIGKAEGSGAERHGHVTALSVAPEYRRLGLSRKFMSWLEQVSDENQRGLFVDLYVRCVNTAAITMYEGFGYSVYRRVKEYYSNLGLGLNPRDEEDGFGACLLLHMWWDRCSWASWMYRYAKTAVARSHATVCTSKRTRHYRQCPRSAMM